MIYKHKFVFLPKQFPATISCDITAKSMPFLHAEQGKHYFVTMQSELDFTILLM